MSVESKDKPCVICGEMMVWEKAMAANWGRVMYCSTACQRHAMRKKRSDGWQFTEETPGIVYGEARMRRKGRVFKQ